MQPKLAADTAPASASTGAQRLSVDPAHDGLVSSILQSDGYPSTKGGHHRRTSSLLSLPSLPSLGALLSSAGLGIHEQDNLAPRSQSRDAPGNESLSTDAELMMSNPSPTEWADEMPVPNARRNSASSSSGGSGSDPTSSNRNLDKEIRYRGHSRRSQRDYHDKSFISFPGPESQELSAASPLSPQPRTLRLSSHTTSSSHDSDFRSPRNFDSPELSSSSSAYTPATSVRYSPRASPKHLSAHLSTSSPPPSESIVGNAVKPAHSDDANTAASCKASAAQGQTLPRSYAKSPAMAAHRRALEDDEKAVSRQAGTPGRTNSLSAASGRRAAARLNDALGDDTQTVRRSEGIRARSINSIRGLAAAWVPARFSPSQSHQSAPTSSDESSLAEPFSPSPKEERALATVSGADAEREIIKHTTSKRPVKLDRRRLDKAVSLAVEAAQAAEEDDRIWEEKRARQAMRKTRSHHQPRTKSLHSSRVMSGGGQLTAASADESSEADQGDSDRSEDEKREEDDDLGFSLDLYISSLGYLISAISDKEAPGLSSKHKQDIRQRLEEGMSKLGFDAKAELERAELIRRELELEREKVALQREQPQPANVIHHHYHTAVPNQSFFGDAAFSRAHAAAKASSSPSSSIAGKIGNSVLDIGLFIGAGALSAVSANLSAIAPKGSRRSESWKDSHHNTEGPKITDLDTDEELKGLSSPSVSVSNSPRLGSSAPTSGTATPRTAWSRAINQNNRQWELAVAFASSAASALASSLGAVARSEHAAKDSHEMAAAAAGHIETSPMDVGALSPGAQLYIAQHGHLDGYVAGDGQQQSASAEDRLILLSASLARALKRSPLPSQLYQLLRQLVSILAAIDARYHLTAKGTDLAVRETSRALRFVRKHDLHVRAVRVAWAAAEAAVAALEAYRDEKGWSESQSNSLSSSPVSLPKPLAAIEATSPVADTDEQAILEALKPEAKSPKARYASVMSIH
ncbi:hypothetical protein BCV70DRAFT_215650 [Testicularia cyperi]|uniref:Uncharacterized protein n=1 Tax=Testicularia cyperi TaxID=1882483 RepID=A0A317XVI2_9BASI|nr:hypothetical protein BCV70DRAFT_215650 [Testicularia cyperi]